VVGTTSKYSPNDGLTVMNPVVESQKSPLTKTQVLTSDGTPLEV